MPSTTAGTATPLPGPGEAFTGRRVAVTGAAGFIGSHLCERLVALGATVVGIDDFSTGRPENLLALRSSPAFRLVPHDVTAPLDLSGDLDYVFHLASPASPADYLRHPVATLRTGALGTMNWLQAAARTQARFLLTSTSEVYGDPQQHPQSEDYWGHVNPVGPRSVYDEAKRYAEALTVAFGREAAISTGIVRIFNTYGPRMRASDGRAVPTFIHQARAGSAITVTGDGSQTRSLCYVDDTVEGLLSVAASGWQEPVNIGNPQEISVLKLAELIRHLCRSASAIDFGPLPTDDPRRRCPDIGRARELHWAPRVGLRDGLARTIAALAATVPSLAGGGR
ncbi:NAD-dependent epimerase/dehydratase family protein [Streptomyces sp. NPDC051173]|uniref:NAD-dependent epimerase/dehydratase family protein n=1 Tax=Streptomyces sp. NPDC051173 TaxID=3155164 RepID=UPI00344B42DC